MKILLTGGTGFIGAHLVDSLNKLGGFDLVLPVRNSISTISSNFILVCSLDSCTDWSSALCSVDVVIHVAGLTHIQKGHHADPLTEYRRVNVEGTLNLARQASVAGLRRFIFISSIKVNGEQTSLRLPFTAEDAPAPADAYGISKCEAEQGLQKIAENTGMEVVIIRPPLVYGQGAKGNIANLIKLVSKGVPLPLGAINNQRSIVSVENLVDFIITCIDHPAAANQVFLVSDGVDLSTTQLLRGVAEAMAVPSRLFSIPSSLLMFIATLLGKRSVAHRLFGSLQVDISKSRELLGWQPPVSVEEGLRRCFETGVK